MAALDEREFPQQMERIEALIHQIEAYPDPSVRAGAEELVRALLDLHGMGLARLLDHVAHAGDAGQAIIGQFAQDELVAGLLLLHGLHPLDLTTRVQRALDQVRPYLAAHGGTVELLGVDEGIVRLRLVGSWQRLLFDSGNGSPVSAEALQQAIEEAVYRAAPDLAALEIERGAARVPIQVVPR